MIWSRPYFLFSILVALLLPRSESAELYRIQIARDAPRFEVDGKPFVPFGVNYYRPGTGWAPQVWKQFDPDATRRDFERMKELGVNCVRVFLSYGSFASKAGVLDQIGLEKFDQFLAIAEEFQIYVHPTGLDHWEGVPEWASVDRIADERTLKGLEDFWKSFAGRYRNRNVIFAYDLRNEPEVGWDTQPMREKWNRWLKKRYPTTEALRRALDNSNFTLAHEPIPVPDPRKAGERELREYQLFREEIADEWTRRQVAAIKSSDPEALVTVGLIQWSVPSLLPTVPHYSGFHPERQARLLDFLEIHFYPFDRGVYDYTNPEDELRNLAYLDGILREVARPGKPVVIGEFGWYGGGKPKFDQGRHPAATEDQQARWCRRVVETTAGLAVGWLNWGFYDQPEATDVSELTGLVTADGTVKAWGREFQRLSREFSAKAIQRPPATELPQLDWALATANLAVGHKFREEYYQARKKHLESTDAISENKKSTAQFTGDIQNGQVAPHPAQQAEESDDLKVTIEKTAAGFQLLRNGQPYFIKGAVVGPGGSLEQLKAAGANSIRTHPRMLDEAQRHGFTALVGLPLANPRQGFDYSDTAKVQEQFDRAREVVRTHKNHPALLMWNLGNEPEIHTTPDQRAVLWKEANRLAKMVKEEDPNHPVMVVIGGQYADMLHELNEFCPELDLVGLNSYAQMLKLPEEIAREGWKRPYVVTEFGPRGHWQVQKTSWKVPLEDDANAKADFYMRAYRHSISGQPACLGSYVFYWAHKQEKTHTWYGMFLPDGSRTPAIDAMTFLWTERWPANRCPTLTGKKLTITSERDNSGSASENSVRTLPGATLRSHVEVNDPDGDSLQITWELRPDVADHPGVGGDWEPSVEPISGAILSTSADHRNAAIQVPTKPGKYRLFVYANDGNGNATTANSPILAEYPAPRSWQPDDTARENLRRSLKLLQSSTTSERKTVRILFYGQSITEQAWWKEVERHLRATYTNANLVIENRAIGGHSAQLLVKTAEADLYPFRPNLVIFHVYGSHTDYEQIIKNIRQRTCADILLQTDHITRDSALSEETNPANLSPKEWDAWMNHVFLPQTATGYGACLADIHNHWKAYLRDHNLKASDLLRDGVHLNAHGEWLMAELLKPYLSPLPPKDAYDPLNNDAVRTIPFTTNLDSNARLEFFGTRADLVFRPGATGEVNVLIDGKRPSEIPNLYGFTRVSSFPNSDWPILLKVGSAATLMEEDWSLEITSASADGSNCSFTLRGSKTGLDGEGVSTNRFVSKSRRIVIEPADWNLAYAIKVFKRPLPDRFVVTWRSVLHGLDTAAAPNSAPGIESSLTIADGLSPGPHSIELRSPGLSENVRSLRAYNPLAANRPTKPSSE